MILLVEDETGIREALCAFLRIRGYEVLGASSHEEARQALSTETPDFLITDIDLGDGDGRDLVDEVRRQCPGVPSLILSARKAEPLDQWFGEHAGVVTLQKPVRPQQLVEWLESQAGSLQQGSIPCRDLDGLSVEEGELSSRVLACLYTGAEPPPVNRAWREGDRLRLRVSGARERHRLMALPRLVREALLELDLDLWPGPAGSEEISFLVQTRTGEKAQDLAGFVSTRGCHLIEKIHEDGLWAQPDSFSQQERRLLWPDLDQTGMHARCDAVKEL